MISNTFDLQIPDFNSFESINESSYQLKSKYIDIKKLTRYAIAIDILCNAEYGITYFNPTDNHVFICLGDCNPFDEETLKSEFIKGAIRKHGYENEKHITITIENESGPSGNGWWVIKNDKFVKFK